uniref:Uncharacterized protein n=1 Tax=Plectus sambesii TaxID=2011161 RepID=A0A914WUJ9_9BILA
MGSFTRRKSQQISATRASTRRRRGSHWRLDVATVQRLARFPVARESLTTRRIARIHLARHSVVSRRTKTSSVANSPTDTALLATPARLPPGLTPPPSPSR